MIYVIRISYPEQLGLMMMMKYLKCLWAGYSSAKKLHGHNLNGLKGTRCFFVFGKKLGQFGSWFLLTLKPDL